MNTRLSSNKFSNQGKVLGFFTLTLLIFSMLVFPFDIGNTYASSNPTFVQGKIHFDSHQTKLLKIAHKYGSEIGYPETLQAILLQESNAGAANKIGDISQPVGMRSYGRMQIKVSTVRHMLLWHPELLRKYFNGQPVSQLLDEDIIVVLLTNDNANIEMASKIFEIKMKDTKGNWAKAVASYNLGSYGARNINNHTKFPYVVDITHKIHNIVRPFNDQFNLEDDNRLEVKRITASEVQPKKAPKKVKVNHPIVAQVTQ